MLFQHLICRSSSSTTEECKTSKHTLCFRSIVWRCHLNFVIIFYRVRAWKEAREETRSSIVSVLIIYAYKIWAHEKDNQYSNTQKVNLWYFLLYYDFMFIISLGRTPKASRDISKGLGALITVGLRLIWRINKHVIPN